MQKIQKSVLLCLALFVASASMIHAVTKVSARSGGFGLGSTWADSLPPGPGDDLIVLAGHAVHGTGGAVAGNVIVRGTLVLSHPGLTVNGNLQVETGAALTALTGSMSFKGSDCINDGTISATTLFESNDVQTISGEGVWSGNLGRFSGGTKRLNDMHMSKGAWTVDSHVIITNRWLMTEGRITKSATGSIEGTELGHVELEGVGQFASDETAGNLWRARVGIHSGARSANASSSLSAPVTVREGATLATHLNVTLQLKDVVIIREGGKLTGQTIRLAGDNIINSGEVFPVSLEFNRDGDQDITGAGVWRGSNGIYFRGSGRKSLGTDMTTSVGSITVEGHLDLEDHNLTVNGGNFNKPASGTIVGTGRVVSMGLGNVYSLETAGNLWGAALEIASGTRVANTTSSFSAPITVRSGATLGSHLRVTIHARGGLTVEPGASITGESLALHDGDFVNNGAVRTVTTFFNGSNTLSGTTGSFGGNGTHFQPGAAVRLDGTQQFGNLTVHAGGAFDVSNQTLRVSGKLSAGGRLTTTASTIEFNGTSAAQTLPTTIDYHNLTINNSRAVNLGAPETVANILRLERGVFNISTNRLTIGSCGQIVFAGGTLNGTPVNLNCP